MFGGILIVTAANPAAVLVEQGHSLLGTRQGEVPAVGPLKVDRLPRAGDIEVVHPADLHVGEVRVSA